MFHYRWRYQPDIWSTAERIAVQMMGAQGTLAVAQARAAVAERMMGRLGFVGSNDRTQPLIEASLKHALRLLDAHLATRLHLLGGRPAMADFGLWAQLYEAATDPTPGAIMRASAPHVMAWVQRMVAPQADGAFEAWPALAPTLMPLLKDEVGTLFRRGPWPMPRRSLRVKGLSRCRWAARRGRRSRRHTTRARWPRPGASTLPPRRRQAWRQSSGRAGV